MPYLYIGAKGKIAVIDAGTGKTIKEITLNQSLRIGIPQLPPGEECGIRGRSRS